MKIITIIGARPQFIKAAVVSREFAKHPEIQEIIVHTGQHYDANMSDIFFEEMQIPKPDYNLNINGLGHGAMTGQMLEKIESVLLEEKPDWVLVYGDTNSTLAGALAAKKLHIRVAHVEAGLRSFNMRMPEEINRILTDRISDILFCPTQRAIDNLHQEGYQNMDTKIVQSGDVMYDAAMFYKSKMRKPAVDLPSQFILSTLHRAENTDDPIRLMALFEALNTLSKDRTVVMPIHPRTKAKLKSIAFDIEKSSILFIEPQGYLEMVYLLSNCDIVLTDSGGLQKEAYYFKKYCITMRDETEWLELVECRANDLVGTDSERLLTCARERLKNNDFHNEDLLYGNGHAGEEIIMHLQSFAK